MPIEVPDFLKKVLTDLDASKSPVDEVELLGELNQPAAQGLPEGAIRDGWFAESSAFRFHACKRGERSDWGTCFGPTMTGTDASGNRIYYPDIKEIDAEIVAYWEYRAGEAKHSVLKARYADLVWDLKREVTGKKPDHSFARIAISAYLDAINQRLYKREINGIRYLERALDLAVSLNDSNLIQNVHDTGFRLYRTIRDPKKPRFCVFLFDLFCEEFKKKIRLEDSELTELVSDLEESLKIWCDPSRKDAFDPHTALDAGKRLINYYTTLGQTPDAHRVARLAGAAMEKFAAMGNALLATTLLQDVHRFYQENRLPAEADRALREAARRGKDIRDSMSVFTTSIKIDKETVDKMIETVITTDLQDTAARIVHSFLPRTADIQSQIENMKTQFPLLARLPFIKTDGLARARIDGVDEDPDGHLLHGIAENISLQAPFLSLALRALVERHGLSAERFTDLLFTSPVFIPDKREVLQRGIERYLSEDWISSIHILTPFIEEALRFLLGLLGGVTEKRDGTIYMAKELGWVLSDPIMKEFWAAAGFPDVLVYLRALLTEQKGLNVRNLVAHGLFATASFSRQIADRLVHVLLLLRLIQRGDEERSGTTPQS